MKKTRKIITKKNRKLTNNINIRQLINTNKIKNNRTLTQMTNTRQLFIFFKMKKIEK